MISVIGTVLIVIGIIFDVLGAIGLLRLPDVYSRIQAATKCATLGTCSIMLGVIVVNGFTLLGVKALLCIIFLLVTSPVAGHALCRAAHQSGIRFTKETVVDKYAEDKQANLL
ncbi:MAG: monovalent cation/H(+) antiporter subunit G [Elusimicrobiota bacterium]